VCVCACVSASTPFCFDFRLSVITRVKREFDTGATQRHLVLGLEITLLTWGGGERERKKEKTPQLLLRW
jgi:hypothetical protein